MPNSWARRRNVELLTRSGVELLTRSGEELLEEVRHLPHSYRSPLISDFGLPGHRLHR